MFNEGGIILVNRIITGVSIAVLGALIACIPSFIFPIGDQCRRMMMECVAAAKAEYGIGVLIVFLAILLAFVEPREIRMGISAALGLVGILASLFATVLLGFCDGSCSMECTCNPAAGPLVAALGLLTSVISFINVFYLGRSKNT